MSAHDKDKAANSEETTTLEEENYKYTPLDRTMNNSSLIKF